MGDEGDFWRDVRAASKARRAELGVECPECRRLLPKSPAKILLPGQICMRRNHFYKDPRPPHD